MATSHSPEDSEGAGDEATEILRELNRVGLLLAGVHARFSRNGHGSEQEKFKGKYVLRRQELNSAANEAKKKLEEMGT